MYYLKYGAVALAIALLQFTPLQHAQAAIETSAEFAYMVDADTGTVLIDKRSGEAMNPSSMSKLMTLYVLFKELSEENITLESTFKVSETAWKKGGSKMFVGLDDDISVEDLIRGIIIQSGNDACIVVAEGIAGSEEAFALRMNEEAKELGLKHSFFKNSTGWPDPEHVMSAQDIVILASAMINDFPEYYHYFAETEFTYAGIKQHNRNRLVGGMLGVDGLKTGHTEVAGYGISLSAKDASNGRRVVLAINGLESDSARVSEGAKLISYGLKAFENKQMIKKGRVIERLPVWFGKRDSVSVAAAKNISSTISKGSSDNITATIKAITPLSAPIRAGDEVGVLQLSNGEQRMEIPLVATQNVKRATGLRWIKSFFYQYLLGGRE